MAAEFHLPPDFFNIILGNSEFSPTGRMHVNEPRMQQVRKHNVPLFESWLDGQPTAVIMSAVDILASTLTEVTHVDE